MAQYYWEADSADEGGLPTNATVSQPWHSFDSVSVEASTAHVDFPYVLECTQTTTNDDRRVAVLEDIDGNSLTQSGITEIYAIIHWNNPGVQVGVVGRVSGNSTSETAVGARLHEVDDECDVFEYDSASFTGLSLNYQAAVGTTDDIACFRVQFDGSTVKTKIWAYGDTEPASFDVTDTTGVTGAGDFGVYNFDISYSGGNLALLAFGFGNNGDAAPTEPVAGGGTDYSVTLTNNIDVTDLEKRLLDALRNLTNTIDLLPVVIDATVKGLFSVILNNQLSVTDAGSILYAFISRVQAQSVEVTTDTKRKVLYTRRAQQEIDATVDSVTASIRARGLVNDLDLYATQEVTREFMRSLFNQYDVTDDLIVDILSQAVNYIRVLQATVGLTDSVSAEIAQELISKILVNIVRLQVEMSLSSENIEMTISKLLADMSLEDDNE